MQSGIEVFLDAFPLRGIPLEESKKIVKYLEVRGKRDTRPSTSRANIEIVEQVVEVIAREYRYIRT